MVCYNLKVCAKCLLRNLELSSSRDLNAVLPSHRHRDTNRVGTTSIALGVLFCNTLDAPCMTSYRLYIYIYNPFSIEQLNQEMCQRHQAQRVNMMFLLLLGLAFLNQQKRHLQTMSVDAMGISHNFHTLSINWCKLRHLKACDLGVFWDSWIPNSICFLVYFFSCTLQECSRNDFVSCEIFMKLSSFFFKLNIPLIFSEDGNKRHSSEVVQGAVVSFCWAQWQISRSLRWIPSTP